MNILWRTWKNLTEFWKSGPRNAVWSEDTFYRVWVLSVDRNPTTVLIRKLCIAYTTMKILNWLWFPHHQKLQNSILARTNYSGDPEIISDNCWGLEIQSLIVWLLLIELCWTSLLICLFLPPASFGFQMSLYSLHCVSKKRDWKSGSLTTSPLTFKIDYIGCMFSRELNTKCVSWCTNVCIRLH